MRTKSLHLRVSGFGARIDYNLLVWGAGGEKYVTEMQEGTVEYAVRIVRSVNTIGINGA